jgi:hypothetical protein
MATISERLQAFNRGRDPERLAIKDAAMAKDSCRSLNITHR